MKVSDVPEKSVTVVLIGSDTNKRPYVKYELQKSYEKGNGMLGIYIHNQEDKDGNKSSKGSNHFGVIGKDSNGKSVYFSIEYPCYDWIILDLQSIFVHSCIAKCLPLVLWMLMRRNCRFIFVRCNHSILYRLHVRSCSEYCSQFLNG